MNIRIEYLKDDNNVIPLLAQWHYDEFGRLSPGDSVEERLAKLKAQAGSRQIPLTLVAFSGETLLGSACLVAHDMDTRMDLSPWLATLFVAPEHQNQGVGSALVERAVEEAQKLGVKTLYLFTWDREKLYARLGWSVIERSVYHGRQVTVMSIETGA